MSAFIWMSCPLLVRTRCLQKGISMHGYVGQQVHVPQDSWGRKTECSVPWTPCTQKVAPHTGTRSFSQTESWRFLYCRQLRPRILQRLLFYD